jgi:GNAT superfamily N-acetyltransferase
MGWRAIKKINDHEQHEQHEHDWLQRRCVLIDNAKFIQIYKDDTELYQELLPKWIDYMKEIDDGGQDSDFEEYIIKDLKLRVKNQGTRKDMHFELFYLDDAFIGFAQFAIVHGTLYGLAEAGNGFILEFYIVPEYRRKGYGKFLHNHIEETLIREGAKYICLTAYLASGEPFWVAMGYNDSGKADNDNNLPVYMKSVVPL